MALEYGALIVDGLNATQQTASLAGTNILTNAEGFGGISEPLVRALARVGTAGWALVADYPNNANQTQVLIFSRQL